MQGYCDEVFYPLCFDMKALFISKSHLLKYSFRLKIYYSQININILTKNESYIYIMFYYYQLLTPCFQSDIKNIISKFLQTFLSFFLQQI